MQVAFKYVGLLVTCIAIYCCCSGQSLGKSHDIEQAPLNRVIEPKTLSNWLRVGAERDVALSPDGKYATWSVDNWREKKITFVVAAMNSDWRREFHNEKWNEGFFTADSKVYIFQAGKGLCFVPLDVSQPEYIRPVVRWQQDGEGRWLAWQEKDGGALTLKNLVSGRIIKLGAVQHFEFDKATQYLIGHSGAASEGLFLFNLSSGKMVTYKNVDNYKLKGDGRVLVFLQKNGHGSSLEWVKFPFGTQSVIYSTDDKMDIVSFDVDNTGAAITFTTRNINDSLSGYEHWYYKEKMEKPIRLVGKQSPGIAPGFELINGARFTKGNKFLYFMLMKEPDRRRPPTDAVMVDVWSYTDEVFYTAQPGGIWPTQYPAVVSVEGGKVVQLVSRDYEKIEGEVAGDYALVSRRELGDRFWEYKRDSIWLVSLKDGARKLLPFIKSPWVELEGKGTAVVGFDSYRGRHYYRYNIETGLELKLSIGVSDWILGIENPFMIGWEETEKLVNHEIAARTADQKAIIVYDSYDIWKVDLTGKAPAVNITNGVGRKQKIVFRLSADKEKTVGNNEVLLLTAFNERSKDNGFYRKDLSQKGDPDSLFMGPYFFAHERKISGNLMPNPFGTGMLPVKAKSADAWLVRRESATESPNYYFTSDFKKFNPLTKLQPQKEYNWYTTELVNFVQENGVANQGVLYKPANFDPNKKYPVLFYYYEQYSYGLNCFLPPLYTDAGKPVIPWYTSREYLVFTPDNYFQKGIRSHSVLQSVEGAARYLSKLPFVDSLRMGIMGLSQGGGFTNYIITHSNLFAAAFEGCGVSNNISAALQWGGVNGEIGSRLRRSEPINGSNMWNDPEYWVGESPILRAHKVTTPLLIMHNKNDGAVLFEQAVEMFTALRRLNKKVWLLQYDNGGHGVGGKEGLDLTIRMTQFFDHYLKGKPVPQWMVKGVPASVKGIETGLEISAEKK